MTVQNAIKILKTEYLGDSEYMELAKQMGAYALEKQIPKKPCIQALKGFDYAEASVTSCPNCSKPIINVWNVQNYQPHYCHYCGQALNFKDF